MLKFFMLALSSVASNSDPHASQSAPVADASHTLSNRVSFTMSNTGQGATVVLDLWNEVVPDLHGGEK